MARSEEGAASPEPLGEAPGAAAAAAAMSARPPAPDAADRLLSAAVLLLARDGALQLAGDGGDEAAAAALVLRLRPRLPAALLAAWRPDPATSGGAATSGTARSCSAAEPSVAAAPAAAPSGAPAADGAPRLRLQHSCRSTACGDTSCPLCRFNTVQPCGRGLATRYLADDPLRAPCGAPVLVSVAGGDALLSSGTAIEVIVIDGERYDGLAPAAATCSDAAPLPPPLDAVLRACAIDKSATRGPLVRAEAGVPVLGAEGAGVAAPWRARARAIGAAAATAGPAGSVNGSESDDGGNGDASGDGIAGAGAAAHDRLILLPQGGLLSLSGLRCCASSEAVLQGKGSRFRLALRAVDPTTGAPLPNFGHAISDAFMVATRRMKQALKRDRPSTHDEISRLAHIGRATAEKLRRLAAAAATEGVELALPPRLATVERVGQFAELAELVAANPAARARLLGLLKLSAANWAEAVAHAAAAVPPDARRRMFAAVAGDVRVGLLFDARNGALQADEGPSGVVYSDGTEVALRCVDARLAPLLPALKEQALAQWRLANHPGWGIYGRDEAAIPGASTAAAAAAAITPAPTAGAPALHHAASLPARTPGVAVSWAPPVGAAFAPDGRKLEHAATVPQPLRRTQTLGAPAAAPMAAAPRAAALSGQTPGQAAALVLEDSLKRDRSETAERRASSMAEARARLLAEMRRTAGGDGGVAGSAPAAPRAAAPWEVSEGDEDDRGALALMYRRWQQGSLSMPGMAVDPVSAPLSAPAMGDEAGAGPHSGPVTAPGRLNNSAPLQRPPASQPHAARQAAAALEAAPWLVLGDGPSVRDDLAADLLTRSLREMSFEAFCGE